MIDRDSDKWLAISEPYFCGRCMYLACALNELYGWPISAYIDSDGVSDHIEHAWVVDDRGASYDVDGFAFGRERRPHPVSGELVEGMDVHRILDINILNGETVEMFKAKIAEAHQFIRDYLAVELPEVNHKKRA